MAAALQPDLLIAVADGGLTHADLLVLTPLPLPLEDASSSAIISQAKSRWLGKTIYVVVDAEQRQRLTDAAGKRATADCVAALHAWADSYRAADWPGRTPEYLLDGYFRLLESTGDLPRMTACSTDPARHARLRMLTGGDVAAIYEVAACQAALAAQEAPDLTAAAVLEEIRETLTTRNDELPTSLPATLAAAGDPIRADQLARSFCAPARRIAALTGLAIALLDEGRLAQARHTLSEIAAAVERLETSGYEPVRDAVVRLATARQWTSAERIARAAPTAVGRQVCLRALVESQVAAGHLDQAEYLALILTRDDGGQDGEGGDGTEGPDLSALRTVIVALAADGQGARAESLARAFPDRAVPRLPGAYGGVLALPELITALAVAGQDDQFHRLVFGIDDAATRSWLLTDVVVAVAAAGDVNRAEELARSIADDRGRADALLELAVQLLAMGEAERAVSVARSIDIPSEGPYRRFLQPWPVPHGSSDRQLLLDVLGVQVRPGVVRALVETGQTDLAEQYLGRIWTEHDRGSAYCELAVARAAMGDTAWTESEQKESARFSGAQGLVLRAVIRAHLAAGDRDRAVRMAYTARTPVLIGQLLCDIAVWMVENGMTADAERFTRRGFEDTVPDTVRAHTAALDTRGGAYPAPAEMQAAVAAAAAAEGDAVTARRLAQLAAELPWSSALAPNARRDLAHRRGQAGEAAGAAATLEELLTDQMRVLGPDHPDTLTTLHDLAHWRGKAGEAAGAAATLEELLTDQMRVLGPDHPDTLTTLHDLAHWRGKAGDAAGAADALTELHDLAHRRGQAGNAVGAGDAFEQLVNDRTRVLGPDHPDTVTALHSLAHWRMKAGYAFRATDALERLIDARTRVLGPEHRDTFAARRDLAHWRMKVGDAAGAAKAFEEPIKDRTRAHGPDHHASLADSWEEAGGDVIRPADALALPPDFVASIKRKDEVRRQGQRDLRLPDWWVEEHDPRQAHGDRPDTLRAHGNLSHGRGQAGDAAGGPAAAFEELLPDRVQGPDHPTPSPPTATLPLGEDAGGRAHENGSPL